MSAKSGSYSCLLFEDTMDQDARHAHFLTFPDTAALAEHLRLQYGREADHDGSLTALLWWYRTRRALERLAEKS